jgi:histone deacetylase complex regulatory component SIN3
VTRLFEGEPDLIEDFKQFLPESAAAAEQDGEDETGTKVTRLMVDLKVRDTKTNTIGQ